MFGLLFLILAFILCLLGLGSYRKRRLQKQRAKTMYHKSDPQAYARYPSNNHDGYYGQNAPAPPPVYNSNPGQMEAGLIQAPPPVYTPYDGSNNSNGRGKEESKGGFRGWIRGG